MTPVEVLTRDEVLTLMGEGEGRSPTKGAASDVDLLVIGQSSLRQLTPLLAGVASLIGREINPHTMSVEEFVRRRQEGDHFMTQLLATPRIFIRGDEDELANMGG